MTLVGRALLALLAALAFGGCSLPFGQAVPNGLTCLKLDLGLCQTQARSMGFGTDATIVGIRLECTVATCTAAGGELKVAIRRGNGNVEESGVGWQSAGGALPGGPAPMPPQPAPSS